MSEEKNEDILSDSGKLLIQEYVESHNSKWLKLFGIANIGIVIAAAVYMLWILPQNAANIVAARADNKLDSSVDNILSDIDDRVKLIQQQIYDARYNLGRLDESNESLRRESSSLRTAIEDAENLLSNDDFETVKKTLDSLRLSSNERDIASRISRIEEYIENQPLRLIVNKPYEGTPWNGENPDESGITSREFVDVGDPVEFESQGGDLIIFFDASFVGHSTTSTRSWIRIVLDDKPVRTMMSYSEPAWTLGGLSMNEVIQDILKGSHTLKIQARVEKNLPDGSSGKGSLEFPHKNVGRADSATAKLIVFELKKY